MAHNQDHARGRSLGQATRQAPPPHRVQQSVSETRHVSSSSETQPPLAVESRQIALSALDHFDESRMTRMQQCPWPLEDEDFTRVQYRGHQPGFRAATDRHRRKIDQIWRDLLRVHIAGHG